VIVIVWWLDFQLPVLSVSITTNFVCSTPVQHVVKFVSYLTGQWISSGTPVSSINKSYSHDITELLLKVALNIITSNTIFNIKSAVLQLYMRIIHQFKLFYHHFVVKTCSLNTVVLSIQAVC